MSLRSSLLLAASILGTIATLPPPIIISPHMTQIRLSVAAVKELERRGWLGSSLTILTTADDDYANHLTTHLLHFAVTDQLPYQVQMSPDGGSEEVMTAWRSTGSDTYLLVAQNLLNFTALLNTDDEAWDWQGQYLFFSPSSLADLRRLTVMYKLQKTANVLFFIPGTGDNELAVYTHQLYSKKKLQFLTQWRDDAFVSDVDLFPEKVVKLDGHRVRVLAVNHAPSVFSTLDGHGHLHNLTGLDVKVVQALSEALNFQPEFHSPGPDLWGVLLPNGTFTGMVGQVNNDEAEIGIGNVFLTEERASFVTFSIPYDFERACFLTPEPRMLPSWMAVSFPFTLPVWILLTASLVVLMLVVMAVDGLLVVARDQHTQYSPSSTFLLILGQFCNQARPQPTHVPMQIVVGVIMMCGFVVSVFYSSNLTAYLMVREVEQPYTSISQIVQSGLQVGGYSDFWQAVFQGSANQHVRHLIKKFHRFSDITSFLRKVLSHKGVLLENTQHLEYLQQTFLTSNLGRSPVRLMMEECINPFGVGAMLKRNSPLKPTIDKTLQRLRESGLVDRFFHEVLEEKPSNIAISIGLASHSDTAPAETIQSLTLKHLQQSRQQGQTCPRVRLQLEEKKMAKAEKR